MKNFGDLTELLKLESFTMCVPKTSFIAHYLRAEAKYEPHVSKYLLAHLRLGDTFVDVGANVGYYSLLAANIVGVGGQVISVEPDSLNVRCILKSKIINSLDMLELWPVSASESLKSEPILLDDSSNSGVRDLNRIIESEYDLIMGVPLDTILSSRFRVDVIKIDIEGREYRAMRGAFHTLIKHRPTVFSEFSPDAMPGVSGNSGEQYLNFMFSLGYTAQIIRIDNDELVDCAQDVSLIMNWIDSEMLASRGMRHLDLIFRPCNNER